MRSELKGLFFEPKELADAGLTKVNLTRAINYTHSILDEIDSKLIEVGADRISQMVELANLSSMVGNLLGAGIAKFSENKFVRNGPHKYPDLLVCDDSCKEIEIKVALENNKPKGHLAKAGYYLACRYVLTDHNGIHVRAIRGETVEIWEARFGFLEEEHFNISNTPGDSGKTAVINKLGMDALKIVYINPHITPYSEKSRTYKDYQLLLNNI